LDGEFFIVITLTTIIITPIIIAVVFFTLSYKLQKVFKLL
jgi:hypothetical protein